MRYALHNHQDKARAYIDALDKHHSREPFELYNKVDFVFTDNDIRGRRGQLKRYLDNGVDTFFVYPHTGRPNLVNDINPAWEHTTAHFVPSEGHARVMRAYGYPRPIHIVGWHLCEIREFQKRERPEKVLFAPIHYRCADVDKHANEQAYLTLCDLAIAGTIELTVRHCGELEKIGIVPAQHPNIRYTEARLEPSTKQIDKADVVVAHQTFLYLAAARGIPAVGMGTRLPAHIIPGEEVIFAHNWDDYVDIMAYPMDIQEGPDVLWKAVDADPVSWKNRMIGEPFDEELFLAKVRSET